jgi:hypothetical protein
MPRLSKPSKTPRGCPAPTMSSSAIVHYLRSELHLRQARAGEASLRRVDRRSARHVPTERAIRALSVMVRRSHPGRFPLGGYGRVSADLVPVCTGHLPLTRTLGALPVLWPVSSCSHQLTGVLEIPLGTPPTSISTSCSAALLGRSGCCASSWQWWGRSRGSGWASCVVTGAVRSARRPEELSSGGSCSELPIRTSAARTERAYRTSIRKRPRTRHLCRSALGLGAPNARTETTVGPTLEPQIGTYALLSAIARNAGYGVPRVPGDLSFCGSCRRRPPLSEKSPRCASDASQRELCAVSI